MDSCLAIGLMSGTSLDGIDAVLVRINSNETFDIIAFKTERYTNDEREKLFQLCAVETSDVANICSMNMYLGEKFATVVNELIYESGYKNEDISFISSHGQTIFHIPEENHLKGYMPSTFQIGDISMLSERTNIGVVGDFRTADMAAYGQGAPLTSYADYYLFKSNEKTRAIQNIGGIGNVTYLPKGSTVKDVKAFDTGPGNMIIDEVVLRGTNGVYTYDRNGEIALSGEIEQKLLTTLMNDAYLSIAPPKTTGREIYGKQFVDEIFEEYGNLPFANLVTTITEFTVQSIIHHYKAFLEEGRSGIDEVIVGGGGTYNQYIMRRLQELLPNTDIYSHERFNISNDAKEALAFTILGYAFLRKNYNVLPKVTGAKHPVIMGKMSATQPGAMKRMYRINGMK